MAFQKFFLLSEAVFPAQDAENKDRYLPSIAAPIVYLPSAGTLEVFVCAKSVPPFPLSLQKKDNPVRCRVCPDKF